MPAGDMVGNTMADENDGIGEQSHGFGTGKKKFKDIERNIINYCLSQNKIITEVIQVLNWDCEECFATKVNLQRWY